MNTDEKTLPKPKANSSPMLNAYPDSIGEHWGIS